MICTKTKEKMENKEIEKIERKLLEIKNRNLFVDSIKDCLWISYASFSAGRWAVDYRCLYTIFRVLNNCKPNSILEFGLGESSKLIHQYANWYRIHAVTYEHDKEWADFFRCGIGSKIDFNVTFSGLEEINYKGQKTLTYQKNCDELKCYNKALDLYKSFDFIFVDAPFGQEHYSRPQILNIVPECICKKDFIIIIDDAERVGELETISELCSKLKSNGIDFLLTYYSSEKTHCVITSPNHRFLHTL